MRREEAMEQVPRRARPSMKRAAAAARLVGAPASEEAVADRMRQAARRSRQAAAGPVPPGRRPTRTAAAPAASTVGSTVGSWTSGPARGRAASAPAAVGASAGAGATALAMVPIPTADPKPEQKAKPRHLQVVPEPALTPAQRRRRARAALIAGIGGATAIALALVFFHVVLAQRQFSVDHLQAQVQQAQTTYQQRRLEVAELGSPAHIISMAEGRLGMVQPTKVTYLTPDGPGAAPATSTLDPSSSAPAGDADWPAIKSQLAGIP